MKKLTCLILVVLLLTGAFCQGAYCSAGDSILNYARQNFTRALKLSGRVNFDGYCGACVSYQLMAGGITPGLHNFNGNQSYRHFARMSSTGTGYSITAFPSYSYSLKNVLDSMNVSPGTGLITPVLLGFNRGTASNAGQTYGHTMLIYAVSDGNVYYADSMYPTVEESVRVLSIDDFCKHYSDYPDTPRTEFVLDGAIRFCNYAPASPELSVSKRMYAVGEEITFESSAVGSSKFFLGIDKDGQRIETVNSSGSCGVRLSDPGVYSAYFTAVNSFGATDSKRVIFEVMDRAPFDQWIGVPNRQVRAGEIIPLSFDARYATAYFIGIANPDGSFSAINTNGMNSYDLCFTSPGTYSVYVTCVNVFGGIDTLPVTIYVQ